MSLEAVKQAGRLEFRARKGEVSLAIIDILKVDGSTSRESLVAEIRRFSGGTWKVSPSSIDEHISHLSRYGFVDSFQRASHIGHELVFRLTESGEKLHGRSLPEINELRDVFKLSVSKATAIDSSLDLLRAAVNVAPMSSNREATILQIINQARRDVFHELAK